MSESASEIIALLPVPIGAPLVVALVVALILGLSIPRSDQRRTTTGCLSRKLCNGPTGRL